MDTSRGSKRSSISFGSYQRQPGHGVPGGYDSGMFSYGPLGGSGSGIGAGASAGGSHYANRSPMYSPLDYSQPIFPPNGYTNLHQFRNSSGGDAAVVCEYEANYPLFAVDWSLGDYVCFGSYLEGNKNRLQVIKTDDLLTWDKVAECSVTFPVSNIQWQPGGTHSSKFATCSDSLRIWNMNEEDNTLQERINLSVCKYNKQQNVNAVAAASTTSATGAPSTSTSALKSSPKNSNINDSQGTTAGHLSLLGELPPITSFHWNPIDTNLLISCSIDTTCIVWDLQSSTYVKTQLIAHDSEVFDVRFLTQSTQLFASCGGDGSVRVFDLRCLAHSTIIYEPNAPLENSQSNVSSESVGAIASVHQGADYDNSSKALLRLEPSPFDPNVIATFALDSQSILILDMRNPGSPILTLQGHNAAVNQIKWHPTRRNVIISCSDDCQVLYWDLHQWLDSVADSNSNTENPETAVTKSPAKSPFSNSNSSSITGLSSDNADPAVSKWSTKNNSQWLDTPAMYYANKGQEINNIIWRPQGGEWLGAISAKRFQNIRI
ncbi:hypothetical protein HG535_0A06760 [Zygotorulaspora mrakii]|uniref:Uncharacterized protein n=1 Tax=Zygotorulaspora mrakii TaxID=42260 RepID=A0A7H9AXC1_ZYGMR|nr:uncharacterized protein HG535_0A06760 [Zygotorulaspora mrakii]QLG70734.1 hypothetical protein HG535_0A06760 [Zygotorulaspora mrakii]